MNRQRLVIAFVVLFPLGIWGLFFWRAQSSADRADQLCRAVKALIHPSVAAALTPGTSEYEYYHLKKNELAFDRLLQFDADLPCDLAVPTR